MKKIRKIDVVQQNHCVRCGNCKEAFIEKHHLNIYQYLVTIVLNLQFFLLDELV